MKECMFCLVSGRVQGVAFRASARAEARRLGVTGWARNRPDGRVEVLACGERAALERFRQWLSEGPAPARVDDVTVEQRPFDESLDTFETA
ncbi:MAG: acylphosphatase [Halofilum sp. (in: g-proteobacteria)]|nr:acylphosphatase [Halofilum sp. (in: g-proteobacteria)]